MHENDATLFAHVAKVKTTPLSRSKSERQDRTAISTWIARTWIDRCSAIGASETCQAITRILIDTIDANTRIQTGIGQTFVDRISTLSTCPTWCAGTRPDIRRGGNASSVEAWIAAAHIHGSFTTRA